MTPWQGSAGGVRTTLSSVVNQRAFSNSCGLPLAALVDFVPPSEAGIQRIARGPVRCPDCYACLNQYCRVNFEQGSWECVMCGTSCMAPAGALATDIAANPEMCTEAVEYLTQAPPAPTPGEGQEAVPHVVLVMDTNMEAAHMNNLRKALPAAILSELGQPALVSVVGCDAVVTLWCLGAGLEGAKDAEGAERVPARVEAHTLPGDIAMDQASVTSVLLQSSMYWAPLGKAGAGLDAILSTLRPLHTHLPMQERPRCLAVGIEVGLRLLAASARAQNVPLPARGSRLMVITAGPTTTGPCSVPLSALSHVAPAPPPPGPVMEQARLHMMGLTRMARSLAAPVDVLAVSSPCVHVSLLSELADLTGGLLWHHRGDSPLMQQTLQAAVTRGWAAAGVLDCYVPRGLKVVQWLGPVNDLQDRIKEGTVAKGIPGSAGASPAACHVGPLCAGQGAAARIELTRDLTAGASVHLQVVLHYRERSTGARVVRVVTRRVRVVGTVGELLQGVDAQAAAAEAAKRLVCDAISAAAHRQPKALTAARNACAALLTLLASRFGRPHAVGGLLGLGSRGATQLAAPLVHVAHALYTLQRGRLLGLDTAQDATGDMHPEERLLLLRTLLFADTHTAGTLASPPLYALMPCAAPTPTNPLTAPTAATPNSPAAPTVFSQPATVINPFAPGGSLSAPAAPSRQHHRLVPLPSIDLVLAAAQHAAGQQQADATGQLAGSSQDSHLPCLVLDLGTRLVLLDCAPHAGAGTGEQLQAAAAGQLPALVQALQGEELPVQLLRRCPVPDIAVTHILTPVAGGWQQMVSGGVSPVQHDQPKQQLVQLMESAFSPAHLELGQFNTVVSQGALPGLFTTAVQLANGSLGTWHQATRGKPKIASGKVSFLQWCSDLGVVLPVAA